MAIAIASVPVLKGEASDRFEMQMQESERKRGTVDFSKSIETARQILARAKLTCLSLNVVYGMDYEMSDIEDKNQNR